MTDINGLKRAVQEQKSCEEPVRKVRLAKELEAFRDGMKAQLNAMCASERRKWRDQFDEYGICIDSNREPLPPSPLKFFNFEEDAERAHFDLEILSPAKWAGRIADKLPSKFEMGRYGNSNKPPEGIAFAALNLDGDQNVQCCSRRYLVFLMTESKDGFNVDLLADNDCKVTGTSLSKGDSAVAGPRDTIEIAPDWKFRVVRRETISKETTNNEE